MMQTWARRDARVFWLRAGAQSPARSNSTRASDTRAEQINPGVKRVRGARTRSITAARLLHLIEPGRITPGSNFCRRERPSAERRFAARHFQLTRRFDCGQCPRD
jgi:hypothetical protein